MAKFFFVIASIPLEETVKKTPVRCGEKGNGKNIFSTEEHFQTAATAISTDAKYRSLSQHSKERRHRHKIVKSPNVKPLLNAIYWWGAETSRAIRHFQQCNTMYIFSRYILTVMTSYGAKNGMIMVLGPSLLWAWDWYFGHPFRSISLSEKRSHCIARGGALSTSRKLSRAAPPQLDHKICTSHPGS